MNLFLWTYCVLPEESDGQRAFAGAGAADDAHLLPGQDLAGDAVKDRLHVGTIPHHQMVELHATLRGPVGLGGGGGDFPRGFLVTR